MIPFLLKAGALSLNSVEGISAGSALILDEIEVIEVGMIMVGAICA
jgi:hypothetical protein